MILLLRNVFLLTILSMVMITSGITYGVVSLSLNQYYDIETNTTGALNSSMDFRCTTVLVGGSNQGITPVNYARRAYNTTATGAVSSAVGYVWTQQQYLWRLGTHYILIVTNEGNYTRIRAQNSETNKCQFDELGLGSVISNSPFFTGNYATSDFKTFPVVNDTESVVVYSKDLGVSYTNKSYTNSNIGDDLLSGYTVLIDVGNSYYIPLAGIRSAQVPIVFPSSPTYAQDLQLSYLQTKTNCAAQQHINTTVPITTFNLAGKYVVCNYLPTVPSASNMSFVTYINESARLDPDDTRDSFRTVLGYYDNKNYNQITGVGHNPPLPNAGDTVTVSFSTTLQGDGTVYFRYKNVTDTTNSSLTAWANIYKNESVFVHQININGTYILDSKLYQYYVISGTANNTNSSNYFYFTTGAIGSSITAGGNGTISTAIDRLSESGFCTGSTCVYLFFGLPILIIFTLVSWYYVNATVGKGVFLVALTLLSITNILPIYLLIPIIVFVAYTIAKMFGSFGGGE